MSSVVRSAPEIFISTGEPSGDLHAARVLEELRRICPPLRAFGIGGPKLAEAGLERTAGIDQLSLVGITEVLPRIRSVMRLLSETRRILSQRPPAAVLLVDSPDFNLRLARHARSLGIKTIYFIGPTLWAWRRGRMRTVRETVDLMLTILPFEDELYRRHGVRSAFVGHPLVDMVNSVTEGFSAADFLSREGVPDGREIVALLPGSRQSELRRLLPVLLETARILSSDRPSLHFLIPAASPELYRHVRAALAASPISCTVVAGRATFCLAAARAAVVASGTATLEAALVGTPFVAVYRLSPLSYLVGKVFVSSPYISLPNILAGSRVVTELIQHDCRPARVASETGKLLDEDRLAADMKSRFRSVRDVLGKESAAPRAAALVAAEAGLHEGPGLQQTEV